MASAAINRIAAPAATFPNCIKAGPFRKAASETSTPLALAALTRTMAVNTTADEPPKRMARAINLLISEVLFIL